MILKFGDMEFSCILIFFFIIIKLLLDNFDGGMIEKKPVLEVVSNLGEKALTTRIKELKTVMCSGRYCSELIARLQDLMAKEQVIDLLSVAGGDGTVWRVLGCVGELHKAGRDPVPPTAIVPADLVEMVHSLKGLSKILRLHVKRLNSTTWEPIAIMSRPTTD
ncbi:hypothetical protein L2E82_10610 [Cichorium intybus]|uniref:Uncharacterized protein n=1 Tax=Cichorium intybus TaxID=13427 RepID=A0ACB9GC12_CICIN|nr:hypothetical protein L2E82_10610 [Cichorium intybus]